MPNFSIPLSGLAATGTALATISNNLANLNTTGYKDTSVNFQDMFYNLLGTNGAGDQLQLGGGTTVGSINTNFTGGSTSATGVDTDVAITGNGFFIVQNGANTNYTRAGDFTRDSSGYLVTTEGDKVMGYPAANGVVNANAGLAPIQVQDGMINPPKTTSEITMQTNLSSDDTAAGYTDSKTLTDAFGGSHVLSVTYTRSASGWNYSATLPGDDVVGGTAGTPFVVASGPLASDSFGILSNPATIPLPAINFAPKAVPLTTSYTPTGALETSLVASVTGGSPYATVSIPQTVTDLLGNTDTVNLNFTFDGATGFNYTTTVASNNLPGYVPGAPVTQVSVGSGGFLASDSAGNLSSPTPIAISVPNFVVPSTLTTSITPGAAQSSLSAAEASKGSSFNSTITIYDSLGTSHVLSVAYVRTTSGWDYNVTLPSSEVTGATGTSSLVASGHLTFDNKGNLTSTAPISLAIHNLADGAAPLNLNWNLASSTGAGLITQVSGASSTGSLQQDGYGSGSLTDFTIDANGTVEGTFTNGTKVLGQIALANFANLQGLTKQGSNNYAATISSGSAVIGSPGTSSLGTLTGKSLELSNVDMSTEFSNLIVAERGFQANAKSVTTFDQIAQDTINLIR